MTVTNLLITQGFILSDVEADLLRFNRLRWYRSTTGKNGYYVPATAGVAKPAMLRSQPRTRALAGTNLSLRINGLVEINVPFPGPDPVELDAVVSLIIASSAALAVSHDNGYLTIETLTAGTDASLEVLSSSAAAPLGLIVGDAVSGMTPDNLLMPGVSEYLFEDYQSGVTTWYQTQLVNSVTGVAGPMSAPFQSRSRDSVPIAKMIGCFVRLVDLQGMPLAGRRVTIHNVFMPNTISAGTKSWGIFRQYEEIVTDPNGYAQLWLMRGATIDVTIAGTGFTRRVQLPVQGTLINLLDPLLQTTDEFGIHQPAVDFAIRMS